MQLLGRGGMNVRLGHVKLNYDNSCDTDVLIVSVF